MANNSERLLTIRILETPAGKEVFDTFIASLLETMDVGRSAEKAKEVAVKNGTWVPLQVSAVIDVLTALGPVIIKHLKRKNS
jgi:hypothetical protein